MRRKFSSAFKAKVAIEAIKYDKRYLETGGDVQRACNEFVHHYHHRRDHSSIGNQPPLVFYKLAALGNEQEQGRVSGSGQCLIRFYIGL